MGLAILSDAIGFQVVEPLKYIALAYQLVCKRLLQQPSYDVVLYQLESPTDY